MLARLTDANIFVSCRDHFWSALFKGPEKSGVPDKGSAEPPVYPIRLGSDLRENMCKTGVYIILGLSRAQE
ncbi:unnamed protein product [Cuscuta campestris]|uniref:Uncharacterized protein n=1 Tax=Cuscuta campestris TaxID=132261 RepID=A0A484NKM8_9ASTE|nr:unnamed protein product [Cuscuta campestris]